MLWVDLTVGCLTLSVHKIVQQTVDRLWVGVRNMLVTDLIR